MLWISSGSVDLQAVYLERARQRPLEKETETENGRKEALLQCWTLPACRLVMNDWQVSLEGIEKV